MITIINTMKILFFILALSFNSNFLWAQGNEMKLNGFGTNLFFTQKKQNNFNCEKANKFDASLKENINEIDKCKLQNAYSKFNYKEYEYKQSVEKSNLLKTHKKEILPKKNPLQIKTEEKFHWEAALLQSGIFLGFQHGFRMTQERTRTELKGRFFGDWAKSVKNLRGWNDGDSPITNYILHPLQGSFTGRIFINNSDRAKRQEFGKSKQYWESRFKAFAWSAVWSTQFELGPISEAAIGNVGLHKKNKYQMAYGDLVVTPIVGTGVLIGEDAIDKYVLKNWIERNSNNKLKIKIFRSILTPTTSLANLLRLKKPWKRDNRSNFGEVNRAMQVKKGN